MSHGTSCAPSCDPAKEPIQSALNNFIESFFGSVTKSCVNNQVVWTLPCDLASGMACYPRLPNEGVACYILRLFDLFGLVAYGSWDVNVLYCKNSFVTFGGQGYLALGATIGQQPNLFPSSWHLYIAQGPAGPAGVSPLTTKGDLFGFDTADARVPVGVDNLVLIADSTQALGLRWGIPASGDTAVNLGAGNGVFASKAGSIFQFKSLVAGANVTLTPTGNDITIASTAAITGVFTESFTSALQVITSAGALTIAHGLTGAPTLIQVEVECVANDAATGFVTGDVVFYDLQDVNSGAPGYGMSVIRDVTNLLVRFGSAASPISILNKTTGVGGSPTANANFQIRFRAWR